MNLFTDVLVIGASKHGIRSYMHLKKAGVNVKIVSSDFDNCNEKLVTNEDDKIIGTVALLSFANGMFTATQENNRLLCSKFVVIASGKSKIKLSKSCSNIYYDIEKISVDLTDKIAVVVGNNKTAANGALELSKISKQVIICNKDYCMHCGAKRNHLIKSTDNILQINYSEIKDIITDENNIVNSVVLTTLNTIPCACIFVALGGVSKTKNWCPNSLVKYNSDGLIVINSNAETGIIPNLFAVGSCATKTIPIWKKAVQKILESINK